MKIANLYIPYGFLILLVPVIVLTSYTFGSSVFISELSLTDLCIISIFLFCTLQVCYIYYALLISHKKSTQYQIYLTKQILTIDLTQYSQETFQKIQNQNNEIIKEYHQQNYNIFSKIIPLAAYILSLDITLYQKNRDSLYVLSVSMFIIFLITRIFNIIKKSTKQKCRNLHLETPNIQQIKGIQYYKCFDFIINKMRTLNKTELSNTLHFLNNLIWRSWWKLVIIFTPLIILKIILADKIFFDYILKQFKYPEFFIAIILSFLFFNSLIKLKSFKKEQSFEKQKNTGTKPANKKNMFIAFHGVSFHEPNAITDKPTIKNISFSMLPNEFISITGENIISAKNIFDLILKFSTHQSGQIYISGTPITQLSQDSIRSNIGFFDYQFFLTHGTIKENIEITGNINKEILDRFDILGMEHQDVYDRDGDIALTFQQLLKVQMTRIAIQKPKIVLINEPEQFDTKETKQLFDKYVNHLAKRKGIIIATKTPETIVSSSKILYLGKNQSAFGTHAELSQNHEYQNFITSL